MKKEFNGRSFILVIVTVLIGLRCCAFFALNHGVDFNQDDRWDKLFTFIVAVLGCAAAILAVLETAKSVKENTSQARTAASLEFLRNFLHDPKYRTFHTLVIRSGFSAEDIEKKVQASKDGDGVLADVVTCILAQFEILALAIKSENVDETILYYALGHSAVISHRKLKIHIQNERDERAQKSYMVEFDGIIKYWEMNSSWIGHLKYHGENFFER